MGKPMGEFSALVQLWNPKQELSRACGLPDQNAIKWFQRDSIPAEYWPEVMEAYALLPTKPVEVLTEIDLLRMYVNRWKGKQSFKWVNDTYGWRPRGWKKPKPMRKAR